MAKHQSKPKQPLLQFGGRSLASFVCQHCGRTFERPPSDRSFQHVYCSDACYHASRVIPLADRFWKFVQKTDSCWLWTGSLDAAGYGKIEFNGKPVKATHVAWFLETGEWPKQWVLHKYDNPPCVRFEHLREGDARDNNRDKSAKGRSNPYDRRGARNPKARLTESDVREIRALYARGNLSQREIGERFGIKQAQVSEIVRGVSWNDTNAK